MLLVLVSVLRIPQALALNFFITSLDGVSDSNVDVFLQAVNGVVTVGPPQDPQEGDSGPQFITPSTTTTTTVPTTLVITVSGVL